jgi:hypothetical protein
MSWEDDGPPEHYGEEEMELNRDDGRREGVVELAQLLLESEFDTVAEVREYLQKVIKKGDAV